MKEKLYTIPLMDAYKADAECPFCFIERKLDQHAIQFTLGAGASYMEEDIRMQTDEIGFCREHYRKMFVYGNRLGSALILGTHVRKRAADLKKEMDHYSSTGKPSILSRFGRKKASDQPVNNVTAWIREKNAHCFVCDQLNSTYERYLATFFDLFKKNDPDFNTLLEKGKGYCLPHFADLLEASERYLNKDEQKRLRDFLFPKMDESLDRIASDVEWFQYKFDYRYKDADWKNSRDSVQRAMQKMAGGFPADPPFEMDK